jgi:hypothetical protein
MNLDPNNNENEEDQDDIPFEDEGLNNDEDDQNEQKNV